MEKILDPTNTNGNVYADSTYFSKGIQKRLDELWYRSHINRKGYRNAPLSELQQKQNKKKSKVRARIEHVFAQIEAMHGGIIRCIGRLRAAAKIGLLNLVYNMRRFAYLESRA
jgi:IS5 family transposase